MLTLVEEIEVRARSEAIHTTVNMLEEEFGFRAKGRTPTARRKKAIRKLRKMLERQG